MKILIISPADLPIPATKGGAIETLVTYVLNENEEKNKLDIDVITPYQDQCHLDKVFYDENSISYAVMH